MTRPQEGPAAPAAPTAPESPEAMARMQAENQALSAQIANRALREAAGQPAEGRTPMGVVKGSDGVIVVTGRDGNTIRIDPKAVGDEDAVQAMVQTALAPPPVPEPSGRTTSGSDVAIVSIIFPCLIVIMLIVWRIVATSKRVATSALGVPAELAGRLSRIEQAIEAVAIEVERIAESERYSARLLTERLPELQPARANAPAQAGRPDTPTADVPR